MTRLEYINKFAWDVINATNGTGLFPSVAMAQAILESADKNGVPGKSSLAAKYNNHHGIKADKSWKGDSVSLATREVFSGNEVVIKDAFRVYKTAEDSFKDRTAFLQKNSRYTKAGVFTAKTPEEQAKALQTAGYATDPNYANTLISLINKHNLKTLDKKKA